ncbi:unnamed protein product [Adineta ricciae]|uniref:G-protein coupled receptors family 1 profile domain-containing protein n=1 Tax=Adineta ricciae TaxID=249248 RepID=A0A816AU59_ADIRI|nr:unnamed protein product [Adineta ricciae]
MNNNGNQSHEQSTSDSHETSIPSFAQFWLILPFYIPSVVCSLFVLYYFITVRTLRAALHNHVIIILLSINLFVQLTGMLWNLIYYCQNHVLWPIPVFCIVWITVDEGLHISVTIFFAWAAIERHILIFHDRLVSTRQKTILFHYLPISTIFLYLICYISIVIIFPPCENTYDYDQIVCGYPLCYYELRLVTVWDVVVNHSVPILLIIVGSVGLLLRILHQKNRMHQPIRWRNYRKLTIQLLSISFVYLILHTPHTLMEFMYLCGIPEEVGENFMSYAEFFSYYSNLLLPFICAGSIPELKTKVKRLLSWWGRSIRTVHPQV